MSEYQSWLAQFASALERGDADAVGALFVDTSYWRDLVAFTWNIVTFEGRPAIEGMLKARLADVQPSFFLPDGDEGWFTFETAVGGGSDGNFTSALGIPTLDGMGAVGEGAHARNESIWLKHLAPRTALLAAMLMLKEQE